MRTVVRALGSCVLVCVLFATSPLWACEEIINGVIIDEVVSVSVVGNDCWYDGINKMVLYNQVSTVTETNEYNIVFNYCTFDTDWQFVRTISTSTSTCWDKTTTECVGSKDWVPSPLCQ